MIPGRMPAAGDGLDPNGINQADRKLNCVGCHTPIQRTGKSPADVGAEHLSFVWAPIFSDLLLHKMPVIDAEQFRSGRGNRWSYLACPQTDGEKTLPGTNVAAESLTRSISRTTSPTIRLAVRRLRPMAGSSGRRSLMGLGRIGPPFLHDGRVYFKALTVHSRPAGTVTTNRKVTNAPLVVRSLDDALLAAIGLHDLPAPDDENTPRTRVPDGPCHRGRPTFPTVRPRRT